MKNPITYLFDMMFPPKCVYCGKLLPPATRPVICESCMRTEPNKEDVCAKCGGMIIMYNGNPLCPTCKAAGRYFDCAYSSARYSGNTRKAIINFKFNYRMENARPLTVFLAEGLKRTGVSAENTDIVIAVPPDSEREAERGFDASGLLAKHIGKALGIKYEKNVLKKIRKNEKQSNLSEKQRIENVKGAYKVKGDVKGKKILLIDDIFTTGATATEISKILKRAGAKYVFVATVSKTLN